MTNSGACAPSALTQLLSSIESSTDHESHYHNLALQIQHNLQYQQHWTRLQVHTHSPLTAKPLPRPLISGLPPKRVYVHPDEQIELLQLQKEQKVERQGEEGALERSQAEEAEETGLELQLQPEREWILPTHLRETWSLRKMAEVFDGIGIVPPEPENAKKPAGSLKTNKWRKVKRVVMATLEDDSTVVYYIVHDGLVKPRQN